MPQVDPGCCVSEISLRGRISWVHDRKIVCRVLAALLLRAIPPLGEAATLESTAESPQSCRAPDRFITEFRA